MQCNQFLAETDVGYQIHVIWIEDQTQRVVGPDLDLYGLQMSFKINIVVDVVSKHFHFVPELLEGIVFPIQMRLPT